METIVMEPTSHLPRVEFNPTGDLLLEGRSIPEDVYKLYNPLVEFAHNLEVESVVFNVNLEYFNTSSSKKLMELFKALDKNENIASIRLNWHYEYGDDDSYEIAEIYRDSVERIEFSFHEHAEIEFALAG